MITQVLRAFSMNEDVFSQETLERFMSGTHESIYDFLGAHCKDEWVKGELTSGVRFSVWAPNASRVSVIGDFNGWDGAQSPLDRVMMSNGADCGIWSTFVVGACADQLYQYQLWDRYGQQLPNKADPLAFSAEIAPKRASRICPKMNYPWSDHHWMSVRESLHKLDQPMSIYELHLGSWSRKGRLNYREIAPELIRYVQALGFTHIEIMPINEFPFDGSWGYQTLGLFAPTSRYGSPEDLCALIDQCHQAKIGVILDWVPGHFPLDDHGLARFDGTALYEHEDPRRGLHPDWGTALYQYGRHEVRDFLISSALFWIDRFHFDGLRVDAVASMLYLDYSRKAGEWIPNQNGGNEHLEAVAFLKQLNERAYAKAPGIVMIAEESTSWPGVSAPTYDGGLGFGRKWNMGWMNDTLRYIHEDPIHRKYHHHQMTFGLVYQYSERFILPISHDEVVHGKGSLLSKMPGDEWQRFANLRLYLSFMWTHPGQKLLFMGSEFGMSEEWNPERGVSWSELDYESIEHSSLSVSWNISHLYKDQNIEECSESLPLSLIEQERIGHDQRRTGVWLLLRRLNSLYREYHAFTKRDADPSAFQWLLSDDNERSILSYLRYDNEGGAVIIILNFTPVPRLGERVGAPALQNLSSEWLVVLNSDEPCYAGSGVGPQRADRLRSEEIEWQGQRMSLVLDLPPLGAVILSAAGSSDEG